MIRLKNAKVLCLSSFASVCISLPVFAEDTVPIPPRRPDVLNVSPAYIQQLMNRDAPPAKKMADIAPSSDHREKDNELNHLVDLNKSEILDILDNKTNGNEGKPKGHVRDNVPVPTEKPSPSKQEEDKTTLISFALKPGQVDLDKNLKEFLQTHAISLFNKNNKLRMEIHAYAQGSEEEQHSDVRVSLARALEVRSFLIERNIEPARLKITPMGRDPDNSSHDRIDLIFIEP
ncbi:MAG: OmpA family protein [Alphaproteobacteria bacterium]